MAFSCHSVDGQSEKTPAERQTWVAAGSLLQTTEHLHEQLVKEAEVGPGLALDPKWSVQEALESEQLICIALQDGQLSVSRSNT